MLFASYVVPHTILFIPIYQVVIALGLDDSHAALIADLLDDGAAVLRVAAVGLLPSPAPRDRGVGAGGGRVPSPRAFFAILLPMSRNVLVAAGLFTLGTVGNDFMLASIFLLDPEKQTVAAGLGRDGREPRGAAWRWPA